MSTLVWLVLICGGLYLAVKWFIHDLKSTTIDGRPAPPVPVAAFAWPELGEYDFEVVGESHYQHVLKALMGDGKDPSIDGRGTAILVPEDTNPHDPKAVKVTVQGLTIGYLSREDARAYRRRLARKKLGMVPASCGLQITGGYTLNDGSQAYYGVVLDLEPFDE